MLSRSAAADELDRFKRCVDLRLLAERKFGYRVVLRDSGRCTTAMANDAGDKVIIRINARDGHWEYFSVRDDRDNGTVIDFVQNRIGGVRGALGEVRKLLREHTGFVASYPEQLRRFPQLRSLASDVALVEAAYLKMHTAESNQYLRQIRSIPQQLLHSKRFHGRIRQDRDGAAVFPHFGKDGVFSGYEVRGVFKKGFSPGGVKGLWLSHQWPWVEHGAQVDDAGNGDFDIVFCESAIDALSHAARRANCSAN